MESLLIPTFNKTGMLTNQEGSHRRMDCALQKSHYNCHGFIIPLMLHKLVSLSNGYI